MRGGGGHIRVLVLQATTCDFLRLDKRGLEMWDSASRSQLWASPIEIAPRILQPHLPCSRLLVAIDMARLRRIGKSGNVISLCRRLHWSPARKGAQFDLYEASVRQGLTDLRSHGSDFVSVLAATRIPPKPLPRLCSPNSAFQPFRRPKSRVVEVGEAARVHWRKATGRKVAIHVDGTVSQRRLGTFVQPGSEMSVGK